MSEETNIGERMIRGLGIGPVGVDAPEHAALVDALRATTDETVVRAQANVDRQRASANEDADVTEFKRGLIFMRGSRDDQAA